MIELAFKKINDEVFLATDEIVKFDNRAIQFVKDKAMSNTRKRARICAHQQVTDSLHEMIIAIQSESYIRPHRHHNKIESFHLIEGEADILILDHQGNIEEIVKLGPRHHFYYRLNAPRYHTLMIHSPILVIHEITNGPFDANASDYADFSPADHESVKVKQYIQSLKQKMDTYVKK